MPDTTKDAIRNCIQNLIKDQTEAAHVDLHPVITAKMQELVGTKPAEIEPETAAATESDEE